MLSMNNKVLFLLKVPPPVHGSTVMNKIVADSTIIANGVIPIYQLESVSKNVDDIGKISLSKIIVIFKNYLNLLVKLIRYRPKLAYMAVSPKGTAFFKDFISIVLIKIFSRKILFHFHVKGINTELSKSLIRKFLMQFAFKNEIGIVLSNRLLSDFDNVGFDKLYVVPNSIPTVNKNNYPINNKPTITFLSNFIKEKGLLEFIGSVELLSKKRNDFSINIIGKEADLTNEYISNKLEEIGLRDFVNHFGPAYGDEKFELLAQSTMLVFPTYYKNECYPLVLLEGMQFSLPVITSDEGAIQDIIKDGENGFIINPHNHSEITEKIIYLLDNPDISSKMAKNANEKFFANNTIEVFENRLNTIIKETIKSL